MKEHKYYAPYKFMTCNHLVLRIYLLSLTEDEVEWKYPEHPSSKGVKSGSFMFVSGMDQRAKRWTMSPWVVQLEKLLAEREYWGSVR